MLDWIKIWGVWPKVLNTRADRLNQWFNRNDEVGWNIIHEVAGVLIRAVDWRSGFSSIPESEYFLDLPKLDELLG